MGRKRKNIDLPPPDLLRLPHLIPVGSYEDNGDLIVQVAGAGLKPIRCSLFCKLGPAGHRYARFRDHPIQEQPVWLEFGRQRWYCVPCKKTAYDGNGDLDKNRRVTNRFLQAVALASINHSFITASVVNAVEETFVRRVFDDHAKARLEGYVPKMPPVLGIDEKEIDGTPCLVIGDIKGGRMLDMQPSRKNKDIQPYFRDFKDLANVEVVCQDMFRGYRSLTKKLLPQAVTVIDKWHVLRMADYGVSTIRRDIQNGLAQNDSRILKGKLKLFKYRWDNADQDARVRMNAVFSQHDILRRAYWFKERFYNLYDLDNRAAAEAEMTAWASSIDDDLVEAFKPIITAVGNWRPFMLNYFEHRYTNAYVEALNNCINKINAYGAGLDYKRIRAKAMLRYSHLREEPVYVRQKRIREVGPILAEEFFQPGLKIDADEDDGFELVAVPNSWRLVHDGFPISALMEALDRGDI